MGFAVTKEDLLKATEYRRQLLRKQLPFMKVGSSVSVKRKRKAAKQARKQGRCKK